MRFRLPEDVAETNLLGRRGHTRAQCGNCKFFFSGNLQIVPLSWRKEPGISGTCWWSTFEITLLRESEHVALRIKRWQLALDKAVDGLPLLSAAHTHRAQQGLAWPWSCTNLSTHTGPCSSAWAQPTQLGARLATFCKTLTEIYHFSVPWPFYHI